MFPEAMVDYMRDRIVLLDGVSVVVERALNETDENGTVGILPTLWLPDEESYEMGLTQFQWSNTSPVFAEPTIVYYQFTIGHMVKHADRAEGARVSREVAKSLLHMLYRDPDFQVGFVALVAVEDGRTERIMDAKVTAQRYAANEIGDIFTSISATELNVRVAVS